MRTDDSKGRSYISAVSERITDNNEKCDGKAKKSMGEARMDIEDSEMAYLGYFGSESYGLTWKVRAYRQLLESLQNEQMRRSGRGISPSGVRCGRYI